jgi:hypothetical protein
VLEQLRAHVKDGSHTAATMLARRYGIDSLTPALKVVPLPPFSPTNEKHFERVAQIMKGDDWALKLMIRHSRDMGSIMVWPEVPRFRTPLSYLDRDREPLYKLLGLPDVADLPDQRFLDNYPARWARLVPPYLMLEADQIAKVHIHWRDNPHRGRKY